MPTYLIERKLRTTKSLLKKLESMPEAPNINWRHSYVTDDKCYCLYDAPNEKVLQRHVRESGFSITSISKVLSILDPTKLAASIIDPTKL